MSAIPVHVYVCLCFFLVTTKVSIASDLSSNCHGDEAASSGFSYKLYDNAALANLPLVVGTTPTANLSLVGRDNVVGSESSPCYLSGELLGTVAFSKSGVFQFHCDFVDSSTGFVWVDGHLVCGDGNSFRPENSDNPLPIDRPLPFRARITSNDTSCHKIASVTVSWQEIPAEELGKLSLDPQLLADSTNISRGDTISVSMDPCLPPAEAKRDKFQRTLGYGWGSWLRHNMVSIVKLPEGIIVTPKLCQISSNTCKEFAIPDDDAIRVGLHAYDRSYVTYHMAYKTANVTMEYSAQGGQLYFLITTTDFPHHDPFDYEIHIEGRYGWFRPGNVSSTRAPSGTPQLTFSTPGLGVINVTLTTNNMAIGGEPALRILVTEPYQLMGFGSQIPPMRSEDVAAKLKTAKVAEQARIRTKFGAAKYAVAEAIQSAAMWTTIYNPAENDGLLMPVSRTESWSFRDQSGASTTDWTYIIFDWDNFFASLLAGLDNKEIAYSNLFQVIKSKTAAGFIPNYATGGLKSQDRTEPMVGAKVMLELFRKYQDKWVVEVCFDDLLDWNNWSLAKRSLPPVGLIALGSHAETYGPISPYQLGQKQSRSLQGDRIENSTSFGYDEMQKSRFESGMDNSPMYDGDLMNDTNHLMSLYDVGMSSLFVQEAYSLAELAEAIGRDSKTVDMLRSRGDTMRNKIRTELWDESQQAFANRFPNGTFSNRISPTSFYPLFTGAASQEQAESMVSAWLLNSSRFCITIDGDFVGNDPNKCYWGLPSISADDPAFMAGHNHYWRGLAWGPLAQLVYWSLQYPDEQFTKNQENDVVGEANWDVARKALCKQMEAMMMNQWNRHRNICENYHPSLQGKGADQCTGSRFYHWGALAGLIGMMEDGHW